MAVLSADKLIAYNGALRRLGSRELASLSENREPRRVLDSIWGANDNAPRRALSAGQWNFGARAVEADATPSVDPYFGFTYAFDKPTDFIRLVGMSDRADFSRPMEARDYVDEGSYWYANQSPIYVRYVSDGSAYGMSSPLWPEAFKTYLECLLAFDACERITNSRTKRADLQLEMQQALTFARGLDAMNEGMKRLPQGSWSSSRSARTMTRGYR